MFSRWMPAYGDAGTVVSTRTLGATVSGVGFSLYLFSPMAAAGFAAWVASVCTMGVLSERRLAREVRARAGEDIGTFARALDRRNAVFDPWVVRAVWDALAPWTLTRQARLPLRPDDVIADLGCADDDLDDVIVEVATRARRTLVPLGADTPYELHATVGDLVRWVTAMPKVGAPGNR